MSNFKTIKEALFNTLDELNQTTKLQAIIKGEIGGKISDPSRDLDMIHSSLKSKDISDKLVKNVLKHSNSNVKELFNVSASLDYYLIFLGFNVEIGNGWLDSDKNLMYWYKAEIHDTNYGKIILKHKYGSIYHFKLEVAQAVERWFFAKWKFIPTGTMKQQEMIQLRQQICCIKNARLIIDISLLKKIFEFSLKDFFYNREIIDFLSSYKFEIDKFEKTLVNQIEEIGCEHRRRLDDCYELIFS